MREIRVRLFIITFSLIAIGIVMIYSSSSLFAYEKYGDSAYFLKRHFLYMIIGIIGAMIFMSFDYIKLRKLSKPLLLVSILLLTAVFIPGLGRTAGGARRWLSIGFLSFQPSEIAKL